MFGTTLRAKILGGLVAAAAAAVPSTASARPHGGVSIEIGDRGDSNQRWVGPVYRNVESRQWVEPVYQTVVEKVWVPETTSAQVQRVYVPELYEWRDVVSYDPWGRPHRGRQQVLVSAAHYEDRSQPICVPGHYEDRTCQRLVAQGYWSVVPVQQVVAPGHWERESRPRVQLGLRLPF